MTTVACQLALQLHAHGMNHECLSTEKRTSPTWKLEYRLFIVHYHKSNV